MTTTYTHFSDLAKEVQPPDKGILSRTLFNDERLKAEKPGEYRDLAAPGLSGVVKQCLQL
jgi:hypothetical protein